MILLGSRALALRASHLLSRCPVDFDWCCTQAEYEQWMEKNASKLNITKQYYLPEFHKQIVEGDTNLEFEIITPGTSSELLADLVENDPETIDTPFGKVPSPSILLAIKDSHKFKKFETPRGCANWYKHACDWHAMTQTGVQIKPEYKDFISLREKETYTHKLPKLNMSKENFFDSNTNGVVQTFVHDDIHIAVALNDRPAYTMYMRDGSEVLTDKKKFFSVSEDIRMAGVIEEAMVLSIERSLVSWPGVWTSNYAFQFALAKVASTITGGYFRSYAHINLFKVLKEYPRDYWEKFQQAVQSGKVRYIDPYAKITSLYGGV